MKALIDTSNPDLFLSIIKDGKTIAFFHGKNLVKKADELPIVFENVLKQSGISTSDISEFYITTGPGSFMGARTALIFVKAICLITKAKLFWASSFSLISKGEDGSYFIDAKGGQFYKATIVGGTEKLEIANDGFPSVIDYEQIIENPLSYLEVFAESKDFLGLEPIYLKDPRVGGE